MGPFVAVYMTYLFGLLLVVGPGAGLSAPALIVPAILIVVAYAALNLFEHEEEPTDDEIEHTPTVEEQMEEQARHRDDVAA